MDFSKLYSTIRSQKALAAAQKAVGEIQAHTSWARTLTDVQLPQQFGLLTNEIASERIAKGFALASEAARRTLGLTPFAVQLVGGVVLLKGMLAEMRTGEGKTLTVVAPAALLALEGKGVHVVTANSYLAQRDAELMRPVYEALGLSVGAIYPDQDLMSKKHAYSCDITYGVGSEFGFDYLKDNLVTDQELRVQRGHFAAIVDEVDSILIDEARVPMIISERAADMSESILVLDQCVRGLLPDVHFNINVKEKTANLTEQGYASVEGALIAAGMISNGTELYDASHLPLVRRLHAAVRAYALYRKDRDYVVASGEIVLVDIGTGRKMPGRRLEDGLHEALEAREGISIQRGTVARATVTYQNFFGLYSRLSGLTGTALTDAEEFSDIYQLETVVIPTNRPVQRVDHDDLVFLTKAEKFSAAVCEAKARSLKGQPVLIGCASIRDADVLDKLLTREGVAHETLTAREIEREAHIIANAGRPGAVTVATNMAGRGTDITLGGEKPAKESFETIELFDAALASWAANQEAVKACGGLYVLGTERNGIRRVDNQLAGRCGRQGDPGEVQFFLSLEDELLSTYGRGSQLNIVRKLIRASGSALGGATVGKIVTSAQKSVENQGFSARKNLMQFDTVLSDQRMAVFRLRDQLLTHGALDHVRGSVAAALENWTTRHMPANSLPETWPAGDLKRGLLEEFGLNLPLLGWVNKGELTAEEIASKVLEAGLKELESILPPEEEALTLALDVIDENWTEHLTSLAELRENVSLKGNTGLNPVFQYHSDAFEIFKTFQEQMAHDLASVLLNRAKRESREQAVALNKLKKEQYEKVIQELDKRWIGRNDSCPCGSGSKYKLCHGRLAA